MPPDELVVLVENPAQSPDPRWAITAHDLKLQRLLYAPLVSVDNQRVEPKMELAERVTPLDDTHWEVVLREAQFSDGRPVTAEDVRFTIETLRDPKTGSRLRQRFLDDGLQSIEVLDARRLRFTLAHTHAPFVTDLDFGILPKPAPGEATDDRSRLPIGAGPFVLVERRGETWHLRRNPRYFGGAPRVERLTIKTIRDDNSRLLALVGGSGDLTQNTISPLLIDAVASKPSLRVETGRSSVYTYAGLNLEDPILKDVRVRRAIALAIDRALIVKTKLRDRAVIATGMLPTLHWAYSADVPTYAFDPERAKQLLDEAGYPDPDGDGPQVRFTLSYKTSNNRFRVAVAQVIASMLEAVGIGVDLRVNEFATFFADLKKGNFQMFTMQIPEIAEPDLYGNFFASSRIPTRENLDAGANRMRYRSDELDRLLAAGRRTLDVERRKAIYADVQRVLARDLPVISLWHEDNVVAMRAEVAGYEILPTAQLASLARTYKR